MKAILVFDVNEFTYEAINDYFTGYITLHLGNDGFIDFEDVLLEPMPEKELIWNDSDDYQMGWNDCIDEILGGVNESNTNVE